MRQTVCRSQVVRSARPFLLLLLAACSETPSPRSVAPTAQRLAVPRRAGFEANRGQWPATVRFVARDGPATLFLTAHQAVWRLRDGETVRMRWPGARTDAPLAGQAPLPGRVHYARGTQAGWRQDVPLYARVVYRDLYPGIDLVFHDERGRLEYDFVVAPGVDPAIVRLAFAGDPAALQADGSLRVGGAVVHHRPVVYQDGAGGRRTLAARYAATDEGVGFQLAAHDRSRPLVIDPQVDYATTVDDRTDNVVDAAVDAAGNLWLVGMTASMEFPITDDAADPQRSTLDDGYVVRLDPQGALVYATYLGGNQINCASGIAVDEQGSAYVIGTTHASDFPITNDAMQPVSTGGTGDGFLVKLDAAGQLVYASYLGDEGSEQCDGRGVRLASIALAPDAVYALITSTTSTEFPAFQASRGRLDGDAVLFRLDRTLTIASWGRFIGGTASDRATRVATDAAGNAYVYGRSGRIFGTPHSFPTTAGAFQPMTEDDFPGFVSKYTPAGEVAYATFVGPTRGVDAGSARFGELAVDPDGTAFVAVVTGSPDMPVTAGAVQPTLAGFTDIFVAALEPDGSALRYGTYLGGVSNEQTNTETLAAASDGAGHAYVGLYTFSPDFPLRDAFESSSTGNAVVKLAPDGRDLVYSSYVAQGVHAIAHRPGALYVAGRNFDRDQPGVLGIGAVRIDEAPQPCGGDCDGDGTVLVNELVTGVRIALGELAAEACALLDADGDGQVVIAELIGAVGALLNGC
jgi:hypothetical protein